MRTLDLGNTTGNKSILPHATSSAQGSSSKRASILSVLKSTVSSVVSHTTPASTTSASTAKNTAIGGGGSGNKGAALPVRALIFLAPHKPTWLLSGSDDLTLRIWDVLSGEKIAVVSGAHSDYIRGMALHPTLPIILTCGDDMRIRAWELTVSNNTKTIGDSSTVLRATGASWEGHSHYVTSVAWNQRDGGASFASASLDGSIKVWPFANASSNATCSTPNFTLRAPDAKPLSNTNSSGSVVTLLSTKGVNCVAYYPPQDSNKPYLVSGGEDGWLRLWDYQQRQLIKAVPAGAGKPLTSLSLVNGQRMLVVGEAGTLITLNAAPPLETVSIDRLVGLERLWSICCSARADGNDAEEGQLFDVVALGGDTGMLVKRMASERFRHQPSNLVSFESGKLVWLVHKRSAETLSTVYTSSALASPESSKKELGLVQAHASRILYSPNGAKYVAILSDTQQTSPSNRPTSSVAAGCEWVIYSSLAWRNKAYGQTQVSPRTRQPLFAWASAFGGGIGDCTYAYTSPSVNAAANGECVLHVQVGSEAQVVQLDEAVDGLFGGPFMGVASSGGLRLTFLAWNSLDVVQQMDLEDAVSNVPSLGSCFGLLRCFCGFLWV